MAISGVCNSWKSEVMSGGHCFNTPVSITGNLHSTNVVDGLASTAGIAVGMSISDGVVNIPANAVVVSVTSATAIVIYPAATGTNSGSALTISGDTFKILLIDGSPSTTFQNTQTNVGT